MGQKLLEVNCLEKAPPWTSPYLLLACFYVGNLRYKYLQISRHIYHPNILNRKLIYFHDNLLSNCVLLRL